MALNAMGRGSCAQARRRAAPLRFALTATVRAFRGRLQRSGRRASRLYFDGLRRVEQRDRDLQGGEVMQVHKKMASGKSESHLMIPRARSSSRKCILKQANEIVMTAQLARTCDKIGSSLPIQMRARQSSIATHEDRLGQIYHQIG
jgi:hypothetical protein